MLENGAKEGVSMDDQREITIDWYALAANKEPIRVVIMREGQPALIGKIQTVHNSLPILPGGEVCTALIVEETPVTLPELEEKQANANRDCQP
jgi:hypothetical protein